MGLNLVKDADEGLKEHMVTADVLQGSMLNPLLLNVMYNGYLFFSSQRGYDCGLRELLSSNCYSKLATRYTSLHYIRDSNSGKVLPRKNRTD